MVECRWVRSAVAAAAALAVLGASDELIIRRNTAQAALLVGDYARAVELATGVLASWPDDGGTHLIRGLAYVALGDFTNAEPDLVRAREAFPEDMSASYNLALIAEKRGDHRAALVYLDEAIAHGLNRSDVYLLKAQVLDRLGRRGEAREVLAYYSSQHPASRDVVLTLAQWARADGDYEKAIGYYEQVLKYGRPGPVLAELAATYEAAGDREKAVAYYLEAMGKGAAGADLLAEFAADYAAAGDFEKARDIYAQLVKKNPGHARYAFGLAFVQQQLGDVAAAEAGYKKVIALEPSFAEAYYNLAAIADADERLEEAITYYRKFMAYSEGRDDLGATRDKVTQRLQLLEGY